MAHQTDTLTQPIPMPRHTHLLRRNGRYYLNIKVPNDLRGTFKRELIREALHTSDPREAAQLVRRKAFEWHAQFEAVRSRSEPTRLDRLSDSDALALVRPWLSDLEKLSEQWWETQGRYLSEEDIRDAAVNLQEDAAALQGGSQWVQEDDGSFDLNNFLKQHNIEVAKDSCAYRTLCSLFRRARLENTVRTIAKLRPATPSAFDSLFADVSAYTAPATADKSITLGELLDRFKKTLTASGRAEGTLRTYQVPIRLLRESLGGDTPIRDIKPDDIEKMFKTLRAAPTNATKRYRGLTLAQAIREADRIGDSDRLGSKTLANYFNNVVAIFNFAVEKHLLSSNPAGDKWLRAEFDSGTSRNRKILFTVDELNRLLHAPLYTGCQNDETGFASVGNAKPRRGRFWVPLLSLFNGLRCNEAAQLYTEDVKQSEGILFFDIREEREDGSRCDKRLKTEQSRRRVPVHPELLRIGFAEFIEQRRLDTASPRLFPELHLSATGYYSDAFGKWFARFVDAVIGNDCAATFHSFRHMFCDSLRNAGVPIPELEALGGWREVSRSSERLYGSGPRLSRLHDQVAKVEYPGLDLRHLHRS